VENTRELERAVSQGFSSQITDSMKKPLCLTEGSLDSETQFAKKLAQLKEKANAVYELFDEMLTELMLVRHPQYKKIPDELTQNFNEFKATYLNGMEQNYVGSWVLFGNGTLLHILRPEDHYELRTSRNIGLLSSQEQEIISNAHIAVGGLSVGGLCATTLAMEGVNSFYITDFDKLATSNLNRISSSLSHIGVEKTDIVAEKIWGIDPFASIAKDNDGFSLAHVENMFNPERMPNVVIDAMDSIEAKIEVRKACRKYGIPLVWMIDMGDGVVQIGTERYDLDPEYPAFHGCLEAKEVELGKSLNYVESCFSIFNNDRLPFRMANSFLMACNNEGAGISQLAGTVSIAAGAISKVVRKILLKQEVTPEFFIDIEEKSDPDYTVNRQHDKEKTLALMHTLGMIKKEEVA